MASLKRTCPIHFAALMLCLLAVVVLVCSPIEQAYANYKTTSENSAQKDLGDFGEYLPGSDIPDGTYEIGTATNSSMCYFYRTAEAAAANDHSGAGAVAVVDGGAITVIFYTSNKYTRLYLGTNDEAAAQANDDGTDGSGYLVGDPADGSTPHLFTLGISALNSPFTIATFSGGDGVENGAWYTREAVFVASDEVYDAIAAAKEPDTPVDPDPNSGNSGSSSESGENNGSSGSSAADDPSGDNGNGSSNSSKESGSSKGSNESTSSESSNGKGTTSGGGASGGLTTGTPTRASSDAAEAVPSPVAASKDGTNGKGAARWGVRISGKSLDAPEYEAQAQVEVLETENAKQSLDPRVIAALVFAGLIVAGIAIRVLTFSVSRAEVSSKSKLRK